MLVQDVTLKNAHPMVLLIPKLDNDVKTKYKTYETYAEKTENINSKINYHGVGHLL